MGCCCSRVWVGKREEGGRREGETERREGALKKSLTECICYQPPWMILSVWLAWKRSSALHTFTSNPRICKGRTKPSVNKCALKMQKVPSQSQPKGATKPLVRLPVERRKKKGGTKEGKQLRCIWCAELLLVGSMEPYFLFTPPTSQQNTVMLKMCFMKSKLMFSGNLYLNYKQNSGS